MNYKKTMNFEPRKKWNVNGHIYDYRCEIHLSAEIVIEGSRDDNDCFRYKWKIVNTKGIALKLFGSAESYQTISQCLQSAVTTIQVRYLGAAVTEEQQKDRDIMIENLERIQGWGRSS